MTQEELIKLAETLPASKLEAVKVLREEYGMSPVEALRTTAAIGDLTGRNNRPERDGGAARNFHKAQCKARGLHSSYYK